MTQLIINLGQADKGNGDPLRTAFDKVNQNFSEMYSAVASATALSDSNYVDPNNGNWGVRIYNSGTHFSYTTGTNTWFDASNASTIAGSNIHGFIVEYHALINTPSTSNVSVITGTITMATIGNTINNITHSENIDDTQSASGHISFWERPDKLQLGFANNLACNVIVMWTARVFYAPEGYC